MKVKELREALEILEQYDAEAYIYSDHDELYIDVDSDIVDQEDKNKLDEEYIVFADKGGFCTFV